MPQARNVRRRTKTSRLGSYLLRPSLCFPLRPATFLPLFVDTLSIFFVVALPPSKDLFPVRLVPARIISAALFTEFLALAFVVGNTVLAVLSAPCLKIGAAPFPPV